jgi:hypothetical protein
MPHTARVLSRSLTALFGCLTFSVLCGIGCVRSDAAGPQLPAGLIVLPDATNIQITENNDGAVDYELSELYPAIATIRELTRRLKEDGWRALDYDVLNKSVPTSMGEWSDFIDRRNRTEGPVREYRWTQQWQNSNRMTAWYQLSYRIPSTEDHPQAPPKGPLRVSGTLLSAETVRRLQSIGK